MRCGWWSCQGSRCVCISFLSVQTPVLAGAGRGCGGPGLSWGAPGKAPTAPAQPGQGIQGINHSSSVTSSGHPSKPPLHPCQGWICSAALTTAHGLLPPWGSAVFALAQINQRKQLLPWGSSSAPGWAALSPGSAWQSPLAHPHTPGNFENVDKPPLKMLWAISTPGAIAGSLVMVSLLAAKRFGKGCPSLSGFQMTFFFYLWQKDKITKISVIASVVRGFMMQYILAGVKFPLAGCSPCVLCQAVSEPQCYNGTS